MTEAEAFRREQELLRRKYYYREEYGNKLVRFAAEMMNSDRTEVRAKVTRQVETGWGKPSNKQR